jgi:hypothetical protein
MERSTKSIVTKILFKQALFHKTVRASFSNLLLQSRQIKCNYNSFGMFGLCWRTSPNCIFFIFNDPAHDPILRTTINSSIISLASGFATETILAANVFQLFQNIIQCALRGQYSGSSCHSIQLCSLRGIGGISTRNTVRVHTIKIFILKVSRNYFADKNRKFRSHSEK